MRKLSVLAAAAAAASFVGVANAALIYGIDQHNVLFTFDSNSPGAVTNASLLNLPSAQRAVAIDFRPADGLLYVMSDTGNLYTVNVNFGFNANTTSAGALTVPLNGTSFGFDFNPAADRLRISTDTDQNLRHQIGGSTIVDGNINATYGNPSVVGSAYTNNDNDPGTGTTLYTIDSGSDTLNIQNPPNNGTQVVVGALNVDVNSEELGFDIEAGTNAAYVAANIREDHRSGLYLVNLANGQTTNLGLIGNGTLVRDITVAVPVIPEPTGLAFAAAGLLGLRRRR